MTASVIAIDPGPVQSAWVWFDGKVQGKGLIPNEHLRRLLKKNDNSIEHCAIEMIASYGMPVGVEVFETCVVIGRFMSAFPGPVDRITRLQIKQHVCHDGHAKDPNVRQALIDRFGPVGTKKNQGPLYGVRKDIWAALAVAVTWWDQNMGPKNA